MTQNDRPLSRQRQEAPIWGRLPAKRLAPICRDALTRHWKGRPPRRVWQLMRQVVFERDGWCCVYCGMRSGTLTCDHVIPVSRGGSSTLDNLVTACLACNLAKSTMTPKEWRAQLRRRKQGR
jgi:5-methylcytosine-specific restriction endonuclease McrA